ncbi:unnamed protein product, partial [Urochloa humidicola]
VEALYFHPNVGPISSFSQLRRGRRAPSPRAPPRPVPPLRRHIPWPNPSAPPLRQAVAPYEAALDDLQRQL